MKFFGLIIILTASISYFSPAFAAETMDSASTPVVGESMTPTSTAPAKAPVLLISLSQYHYSLDGGRTANTQIYKFGEAKVDMSLIVATYLASADWTVVTLIPHIKNEVETIYEPVAGGLNFKGRDVTEGLGDVRVMALTPIVTNPKYFTMFDIGFSAPTGSIDEKFLTNPNQRASYNMQLGSGTPDFYLGTTTTNTTDDFSSSARFQVAVRGGRNSNGWALGEEFQTKLASNYTVTKNILVGAVANYKARTAIRGKDTQYELMNGYVGTNGIAGDGHQYYHAEQISWDGNLMAKIQTTPGSQFSAAFEIGAPVFQGFKNKDDVELNTNYFAAGTFTGSF